MNRRHFLASMAAMAGAAVTDPVAAVRDLLHGARLTFRNGSTIGTSTVLTREYSSLLTMTLDYHRDLLVKQIHEEHPVLWYLQNRDALREKYAARRNGDFRFFDQKAIALQK